MTGTGKTLLGIEFIYRGIVFETNPCKLIRDAAAFGWNLEELQRQRKLQIIFTSPEVFDQQLRSTESLLLEIANETLETGTVNI
jgi:KaiC/GvpD/RAD55 family RecA-like ATPase